MTVLFSAVVFCCFGCRKSRGTENGVMLKVADIHPEGYPTVIGLHEFSRLASERSNGRIQIQVAAGGVEGDEVSIMEKVQFGQLDFARVSVSPLSSISKELETILIPGEFRDSIHYWKVLDGPVGDELLKGLEKYGFYGFCYYDSGARSFYASKKITSLKDLKGLKIRVQQSPVMVEFANKLGAHPVPLKFEEIGEKIKRGGIDGAENNIPSYETSEHYKVAPYYFKSEHMRIPDIIIGSKKTLSGLSKDDFKIILEAAEDSAVMEKLAWLDYEKQSFSHLKKAGIEIIEPDVSLLRKEMKIMYDEFFRRFSPEQQEIIRRVEQEK